MTAPDGTKLRAKKKMEDEGRCTFGGGGGVSEALDGVEEEVERRDGGLEGPGQLHRPPRRLLPRPRPALPVTMPICTVPSLASTLRDSFCIRFQYMCWLTEALFVGQEL